MNREPAEAAASISWAELPSEDLVERVQELGSSLDLDSVKKILRSSFLDERVVAALLEQKELCASYEVRKLIVASPRAPLARALQWIPGLYWRDLQDLARNLRVSPIVRRSAERYLVERLPGMAIGERISLARLATGLALNQLRHDSHPRVVQALLENPRLTEGVLLPMASSQSTAAEILRILAESARWGGHYTIRVALSRNPRTPVEIGLRILPGLKKIDREAVAGNLRLPPAVRKRANVLLGKSSL
jgi:hypothetical protein